MDAVVSATSSYSLFCRKLTLIQSTETVEEPPAVKRRFAWGQGLASIQKNSLELTETLIPIEMKPAQFDTKIHILWNSKQVKLLSQLDAQLYIPAFHLRVLEYRRKMADPFHCLSYLRVCRKTVFFFFC